MAINLEKLLARVGDEPEGPGVLRHAPTETIPRKRPSRHLLRQAFTWLRGKWPWFRKVTDWYDNTPPADRKDRERDVWLVWFGISFVSLLLAVAVARGVLGPWKFLPLHVPQTPQQEIPVAGWPAVGKSGQWLGFALMVGGSIGAFVWVWKRARKLVPLSITGFIGLLVVVQFLIGNNGSAGTWLANLGLIFALVGGLMTMMTDTKVRVFLRFGVLFAAGSIFFMVLPALVIWTNFSYQLFLWLAALWLIIRGAWQIADFRRARFADPAATADGSQVVKMWISFFFLALVVAALPMSSQAWGERARPPAGTAGSNAPLGQACKPEACVNILTGLEGHSAGKQQLLESLCKRHPDDPECGQLEAQRQNDKTDKKLVCELYKSLGKKPDDC